MDFLQLCDLDSFRLGQLGQGRFHLCLGNMVLPTEVGLLSVCQLIFSLDTLSITPRTHTHQIYIHIIYSIKNRKAIYFCFFFCGRFWNYFWVPGSMLSCFSAFLVFAFPASLLVCFFAFPASLLFCVCALPASFFSCFSSFPASLRFCFCASVPFYFYYSTFSCLQACVFVALLPAPLLLCFLSLLHLCFFFSFALLSPVCKHPI